MESAFLGHPNYITWYLQLLKVEYAHLQTIAGSASLVEATWAWLEEVAVPKVEGQTKPNLDER